MQKQIVSRPEHQHGVHGHDEHGHHHHHPRPAAPAVAKAGSKEVECTCAMHPQVRRIGPGNCPICGMTLEPVVALEMGAHVVDLHRLLSQQTLAKTMSIAISFAMRSAMTPVTVEQVHHQASAKQ